MPGVVRHVVRSCGDEDRTILLLVKDVPGAPTPAQIVDYSNAFPHAANPPLQAFKIKDPAASYYLLPDRASGDFQSWLQANPHSARRKLEDYVLAVFESPDDLSPALAALQADPYVESADIPLKVDSPQAGTSGLLPSTDASTEPTAAGQYGWDDLNLDAAWRVTGGGYAQVALIDEGAAVNHAALRAFDGSSYVGGNLMLAASKDVGLTGQPAQPSFDSSDIDEGKAMLIPSSPCTDVAAVLSPDHVGHGTHTAGLLGANEASGLAVRGTCKHCGLVEYRSSFLECFPQSPPQAPEILPTLNPNATDRARTEAVDTAAQVINMSFGKSNNNGIYGCVAYRNLPPCLSIAYAASRDVAMVASSGNRREEVNFPASDTRVIAAGGFQPGEAFWDDWPNCPPSPFAGECGSNFSKLHGSVYVTHQELLGSAKAVLSTVYPNADYNETIACGDSFGTPSGDGIGWCTGTSMSAPQIAGAVALLRSINPLAPMSEPEPAVGKVPGVRTVLAQTASRAQQGQAWSAMLGYGVPDVAAAARRMLGKAAGGGVRNRATPLFRLYGAFAKDFAESTSPQYALSLMIAQTHDYTQPVSGLGAAPVVPGYAFPYDGDPSDTYYESSPPPPRAAIYVLTTNVKPRAQWPELIPLYLMDKPKAGGRDHLLVTTTGDIEAAHAGGYNLRTLQGFVFQACAPEPACIPPSAQALYRECNTAAGDCATFLENERVAFEAAGYTANYPAGAAKKLGYAYPAADDDGDGLPNGFEEAVGTNPTLADSDADGANDSSELPLAGIPVSDPCGGGIGAIHCPADRIFDDGFDGT